LFDLSMYFVMPLAKQRGFLGALFVCESCF
jgi:hypothetical protein